MRRMRPPLREFLAGHGGLPWPLIVLLLAAAVVPSAAVLWFMNRALASEREALQARLAEAYRGQLSSVAASLRAFWAARRDGFEEAHEQPWETFARIHSGGLADSAVVLDDEGRVLYPDAPRPSSEVPLDGPAWAQARGLEDGSRFAEAAARYLQISQGARSPVEAAHALRARVRCLVRAGRLEDAAAVVLGPLATERLAGTRDGTGRLVAPDALLYVLERTGADAGDLQRRLREALRVRIARYDPPHLPASQRRFLYAKLREVWPAAPTLPALAAEELAVQFVSVRRPGPIVEGFVPSGLPGVLALASPRGRVIALYREDHVARVTGSLLAQESSAGVRLALLRPGEKPPAAAASTVLVGGEMRDWGVALEVPGDDPFASALVRARSTYLWAAAVILVTIAAGSVLTGRALGRQVRLTRLKNDLIATVSHEMRTPVASMRVLLDNLIDGGAADPHQVREYVEMLSKENLRLAALVESFLTFSRLERGRWKLERGPVPVDDIVSAAVAGLRERLSAPGCELSVEVAPGLPPVLGDRGALVTVVANLVENAVKYSGESKKIQVRARAAERAVVIEVADNGVGFSRRDARRIFEPFYQVDRRLSRTAGGCGLGLSIVKSIVEAHAGAVEAHGEPGKGATFSVSLPA